MRGDKRRRSAEEEFLGECPARSARVACRDRPAMIGYQKALLVSGLSRRYCRAFDSTPGRVLTESLAVLRARIQMHVRCVLWSAALYVRDVRLAAVILIDPGQGVRE